MTTTPEKKKSTGMMVQLLVSIVAIVLGALLVFVPDMKAVTLCYIFCSALIVLGIVLAVRFFLGESFKRLNNYQFSVGIILVMLGICGLINAVKLSESLDLYMGILALVLGALMLESVVRLQAVNHPLWIPVLVIAVLTFAGAVPILAGISAILENVPNYTYWVLFIVGILNLVSMLLTWIGMRKTKKEEEKAETPPPPPQPAV
ncbi:MAG: DUF308 domain-containing protein [Clostridia bacterium]|nr:DUF308 domain-containing protein [Clostridia bacterium]